MMLNSLTFFDEGILSSRFCLGVVCSAEGGGVNIVKGETPMGQGLRAKERSAEGTAGDGMHWSFLYIEYFCFLFYLRGRWGRWEWWGNKAEGYINMIRLFSR